MTNRSLLTCALALTASAMFPGSANADVLYSYVFDGPDVSVAGIAPDVVVSGTVLGANHGTGGTWATTSPIDQDGSAGSNSLAKLAFDPQDGYVYILEMTGTQSSSSNDWIGVGYFNATASQLAANGVVWGLSRPGNSSSKQVAHYKETGGTGNIGGFQDGTALTTLTIMLDTTGGSGNWEAQWFVNGSATPFATQTLSLTAENNISAVGVGTANNGASSDFTSFSLSVVPEPGSLALLGLGGLLVAARRRRG